MTRQIFQSSFRKILIITLVLLLNSNNTYAQHDRNSKVDSTRYFVFHNNYWVNLHHFLYQKAKKSQLAKLKEDGFHLLEIGEQVIYNKLTKQDHSILDDALDYYRQNIIHKSLIRELEEERIFFQKQEDFILKDTLVNSKFKKILNRTSKVYQKYFWPIHKEHNINVLEKQLGPISLMEKSVISQMEKLALSPWPQEKIRVDLTVYSDFAGAYTVTKPKFNSFISTLSPGAFSAQFLETIFHEGSHVLFRYGGPWREAIFEAFKNGDYKQKYPNHLWHLSLFYLCGKVCQDIFNAHEEKEYKMILFKSNIFQKYQSKEIFAILNMYYGNQQTFKQTIVQLLNHLEHFQN